MTIISHIRDSAESLRSESPEEHGWEGKELKFQALENWANNFCGVVVAEERYFLKTSHTFDQQIETENN